MKSTKGETIERLRLIGVDKWGLSVNSLSLMWLRWFKSNLFNKKMEKFQNDGRFV